MLARVRSVGHMGLESREVKVEVDVAERGLPGFTIVGLASKAVEEAKERVKAAIENSGASFPAKRITVNLAPADLPKEGSAYDLAIGVGILAAEKEMEIEEDLQEAYFYGELGLGGEVRHTRGVLLVALEARRQGVKRVYVPVEAAMEAAVVKGVEVYPVRSLRELVEHLAGRRRIEPVREVEIAEMMDEDWEVDLGEVVGQEEAKRALVVAAAGGHNLLMTGAPGAGKTMLAKAMPGILPPLSEEESLEVTRIYSVAGLMKAGEALVRRRPFRAPHHTTSQVGLIGGGSNPRPGEVSLAHLGVLFLDELPEFERRSLEVLRQPMEDGVVTISRAKARVTYPASFMLLASANPCPCGYYGHPTKVCKCTPRQIASYRRRVSGPILDRIDIQVWVEPVEMEELGKSWQGERRGLTTKEARVMVREARARQERRFKGVAGVYVNGQMNNKLVRRFCRLDEKAERMLKMIVDRYQLSARGYFKVLKVARTIADLEGREVIGEEDVLEAGRYRERRE